METEKRENVIKKTIKAKIRAWKQHTQINQQKRWMKGGRQQKEGMPKKTEMNVQVKGNIENDKDEEARQKRYPTKRDR